MNSGDPLTTLLEQTLRFGMMTVAAGSALDPSVEPNAILKRLATLVGRQELETADYIRRQLYWHPYASHVKKALLVETDSHVKKKPRRPGYGADVLPRRAAILNYCLLGTSRRQLCCWGKAAAVVACGEQREAVFVDMATAPDHVARKLARYCRKHDTSKLSTLVVLVTTQEKGTKVWRAAKKHDLPLPVVCVAIDDLRELLSQ